mmetsp:Transcript_57979/g.109209  ORF Transcript_57979/g.109209 Transcript_57979/m.109209 type:complete len:633 (-) Transcript_57979:96-1994(-)
MENSHEYDDELDMDHDWTYKYNRRLSCFSHSVSTVAFSQDGRWLVSATGTGDVKVWNTGNWAEAAKLKGCRREEPRALTISPAQRWLVVSYPSVMHIFHCQPPWRLEWKLPAPLDMCTKEPSEWCCVTFSPLSEVDHPGGKAGQDNHLAAFSSNALCVMDYSGGWGPDTSSKSVSIFSSGPPTSITYTSCGSWLLCGFESGELQIWNHFSLTLEKSLKAHTNSIHCLTASPRGACYDQRFVSCGVDQTLRVWHTFGWILEQIVPETKADRAGVRGCTFSSSGNWLVSVAVELCIWAVCVTSKGKMQLRLHQRLEAVCGAEGLRTAAFCSKQDSIAVGSRDGVLGLWMKQPGAPPDQIVRSDSIRVDSMKGGDSSRPTVPWVMSRPMARPMMRLTPDGLKSQVTAPVVPQRQNWALRTQMRSLSMTSPAKLEKPAKFASPGKMRSVTQEFASPGKMRSVTQAGSSAINSPTLSDSRSETPPSVTAKLIAVRDRARAQKAAVLESALLSDADSSGDGSKTLMNKSQSNPELKRWKPSSFEFSDVLSDYVQSRSDNMASTTAGLFSPPVKKQSRTLPAAIFEDAIRAAPSPTNRNGKARGGVPDLQKRSLQASASRVFVQRISLEPHVICQSEGH